MRGNNGAILRACKVAGYKGDMDTAMDIYSANRISIRDVMAAYTAGKKLREAELKKPNPLLK